MILEKIQCPECGRLAKLKPNKTEYYCRYCKFGFTTTELDSFNLIKEANQ